MRIRISHATTYVYDTPPTSVTQMLRLTPRNHDGQYVVDWRIDLSQDCQLHQHEDAFGNITHSFTAEGPFDANCRSRSRARSRRTDTQGVVSGAVERFPPQFYLRETALTASRRGHRRFRRRPRAPAPAATRSRCCTRCSPRSIAR